MKVTKESASSTEVTLNVEMDPEDEDPFLDRSYRRLVGRVRIPGFRPGKAPRSRLESFVGREGLIQEALDFMIPETLNRVLAEEDLQAFIDPQVELLDMEPVSFKAVVALEPVVDLGDFHSIRVAREEVEITEDQVKEVMERFQFEAAPWEPVSRPVKFGDLVNLNVQGAILGEQVIDNQGVDYIPQLDNPLPFPGFSVYLEGMTEGQEKEFSLPIPEDYPQTEYAGKECRFQVSVISIKEKQLPEMDDEFAKGVGEGYDSLEALRAHVQNRLTEESENQAKREFEEKSLEELISAASVQLSDMILQQELELMQQEQERALRNQRLDMDTYLGYLGKTREEFQDELRPGAEQRLTRFLVMRKLAQEENIEVSEDEIREEISSLIESSGESSETMRQALSSESARDSIRSSLFNRKVMQRLGEIAQGGAAAKGASESAAGQQAEDAGGSLAQEETEEEAATGEAPDPEESPGPAHDATDEGAESNAD